jgi:PAS domain S-box-containing protein
MSRPLRVLIVEDSEDDARLLADALRRGGYPPTWRRVETAPAMTDALTGEPWDLVIADYRLPAFSGPAALALVKESGIDVPFIVVSGTIGEVEAVTALKAGAHDFLLKDNLARLVPAVERELREAENRRRGAVAEAGLRRSEERYRGLMEGLPVGVYRTTPDGIVLEANSAMATLLGYPGPEALLGRNVAGLYTDPADRDHWRAAVERDGGPALEHTVRRADGQVIWVRDTGRAVRDERGLVRWYDGVLEDITARKQAEADLARRQAELEALVAHSPDSITRYDRDLRFTFVSPAAERASGEPSGGRIGKRPTEVDPGQETARRWERLVAEVFATGKEHAAEWECRDERKKWVHVHLVPETDADGAVGSALVIGRDITPLKRAQQHLESQEAYFRGLIEHATDMIAILDADGVIRYASPSVHRTLGYLPPAVVGWSVFGFVHPDDVSRLQPLLEKLVANPALPVRAEHRVRHADGSWHTLESSGTNLLADPAVGGVVVNARDVTERVALEEQLQQAQKLEAVGRLAGGVAHDFNNLLTVIQANGEFLLNQLPDTDPRRTDVEEIRDAAQRGAVLTRQLLAFSRRQVVQPRVLELNVVVADMTRMFGRLLGEDIDLKLDLDPAVGQVLEDAGQLEQVLLNLSVNARDAMPGGGRLTIATRVEELDAEAAGRLDLPSGRYAQLSVTDTGTGIEPAVMARMFEPFFTTKARGTGLGLATVYGIVQQAGGHIGAVSTPGQGATFTIRLPETTAAGTAGTRPDPAAALPLGSETVLLVEDEAPVRSATRRALERCGYHVLEAESGDRAVQIAESFGGHIGLVITDVVMPRMSGPTVAQRVVALRPGTPVLYATGYGHDAVAERGGLEPGVWLLEKPFSGDGLARKVREILDASAVRVSGGPAPPP